MINPFTAFFDRVKGIRKSLSEWKEFGTYRSRFSAFGTDAYKNELVRASIRCLSEHTAKAEAFCTNKQIEKILKYSPNQFMTGKDFIYKVRTHYELMNTAFIVVQRDKMRNVIGFYPMPYKSFRALQTESGNIYIEFDTNKGQYVIAWEDLVVLRKDYNGSDIAGDDNTAILQTLEMINTSNQSLDNAVKSTANLRGIIKTTKSMLSDEDLKAKKDAFVNDYMNISNAGGIAALDSTMEFQQINIAPEVTSWTMVREFRDNLFRYFGVNDDILMSRQTPEQMQAFYESQIEPFLIALSREMTRKVFTDREISFGNAITYSGSTIQFMSTQDKLNLVQMVDRGAMTPNEWREVLNMPPIEGGDVPIRRLDTAPVDAEPVDTEPTNEGEGTNGEE